jgi:hypothetical protein
MGRGGAGQFAEDFNLVATRGGHFRDTALGAIGNLSLDDQQWSAVKALVTLAAERPEVAGYSSELIRLTAADQVVNPAGRLKSATLDRLLDDLEKGGLIGRTTSSVDAATGHELDGHPGWRPSSAGVQFVGAFMTADWDHAAVGPDGSA